MERAGFACERCQSKDDTLNVHHSYYEKGNKPWEYPDRHLHCLCEECHKTVEEMIRDLRIGFNALRASDQRRILKEVMDKSGEFVPNQAFAQIRLSGQQTPRRQKIEEMKKRIAEAKTHEEKRAILVELGNMPREA
jgi:hypothetical protein